MGKIDKEITTEKVAKEKTKQNYKGEMVAVKSLPRQDVVPVEAVVREAPRVNSRWGLYGGGTFPSLFLITSVEAMDGMNAQVVRFVGYDKDRQFKIQSITVEGDFEVKVLTGTMKQKMLDAYYERLEKNMISYLGHAFRVGADPEIFVENEKGIVVPAFDFLGSSKKPNRTRDTSYGNLPVYWDGPQAEFQVSAENCLAWTVDSTQLGLEAVDQLAREFCPTARLSTKTVMEIPSDILENAKEEYVSFGCMPSLNIYGLEGDHCPPRMLPFRSAGGHIHFGVGTQSPEKVAGIIKSLDAILAVSCVSLFENFDNPIRRKFYGLPGEYRLPKHGIEYRVLSNAWLFHPLIMNLVFDLARKTLVFGQQGFLRFWKGSEEETIDVVRSCDVKRAREIMDRNKNIFCQLVRAAYDDGQANLIFNIFKNGMESAIRDPSDLAGNWNLRGHWTTHCEGVGKNWRNARDFLLRGEKV